MMSFISYINETIKEKGKHKKKPIKTICFKVTSDFINEIEKSEDKIFTFKKITGYKNNITQDIKIVKKNGKKILDIEAPWSKNTYMETFDGDVIVLGNKEIYRIGKNEFVKTYTDDLTGKNPLSINGIKDGTNIYVKYGYTDAIYINENTPLDKIKKELKLSQNDDRIKFSDDKKYIIILTVDNEKSIWYPIHGKDGKDKGIVIVKGPNNDIFTNTFKTFTSIYEEKPFLVGSKVIIKNGKEIMTDNVMNYFRY